MNWSGNADRASVDYALEACVLVYNTDFGPYFGSILGLGPEPISDYEFGGLGVYYLYLGWANGEYWITVLVSLWWFVIASLVFPVARTIHRRRYRVKLQSLLVAITIAIPLLTLAPFSVAPHPAFLLFDAAVVVGATSLLSCLTRFLWKRVNVRRPSGG